LKNKSKYKFKATLISTIKVAFFVLVSFNSTSQVFNDSLLIDTSKNVINILGADYFGDDEGNLNVAKFVGNARFSQDGVFMRCDVGYLETKLQYLKAVGNVIVNEGDSLYLYGDSLDYDGETKIAIVRGNVRLEKGDMTLSSSSLLYDLNTNIAYYTNGGTVVSKKNNNTLTSTKGYYYSNSQQLSFKENVVLTNPDYTMTSDTLDYNEVSEIAYFSGNTFIKGEGNLIFCKDGYYDTRNDISEFNQDAYLISDGHKIEGQKLYYDRNTGFGKALRKVTLTDTANKVIVKGDYATRNEITHTSFVTGNTLVNKWFEEGDTLFLSADTIKIVKNELTKKNSMYCYHSVRFYKKDIQGVCDSMVYLQSDSVLQMFQEPIIWSENSQMNGDTIYIHLANNKIDELRFRRNSFIIDAVSFFDSITKSLVYTKQYDQIKGKNITGLFSKDSIRKVIVTGNGQSIFFTGEDGKRKQGLNRIDCSDIEIRFEKNKIDEILFIKEPAGKLIPIQDVKSEDEKLKGFMWKIELKPFSKNDLIKKKEIVTDKTQLINE
jgi:lipopolysaccharide export system protein LptA